MSKILGLQEQMMSGTCETDELYVRVASKGVPLSDNVEARHQNSAAACRAGPDMKRLRTRQWSPYATGAPPKLSRS